MSCVPSSAATAASKRPPSRSQLEGLVTDEPWLVAVDTFRARSPRRHDRIADYERLLDDGVHLQIGAEVLAERYRPAPPVEGWLNKADGRKKRVFRYPAPDELLFRVVNRLLQPAAVQAASPWCQSFLPGGGARSAFRSVLAGRAGNGNAALRLDVRDYFNSIDVADLLGGLPESFTDGPVSTLLAVTLRDRRVERAGSIVDGGQKGIMAGTPIAPLLATLYLRDLDHEIAQRSAAYARYSDDILVLAPPADLKAIEVLVRRRLAERGLDINEGKSAVAAPGQPWDFLGFRYHHGAIGLAPLTDHKLRARTTRLARGLHRWRERTLAPPDRAVGAFMRRFNRRLYGVATERADFSWATWFLPMLSHSDDLQPLDEHAQREIRYAATGRRTARAKQLLPYSSLVHAGYLPLVSAYWAVQQDRVVYEALVSRRTGLTQPPIGPAVDPSAGSQVVGDNLGQLGDRGVV
jgi:RNA-directed DNA polymerase